MSDSAGFDIHKVIADAKGVITTPTAFYQTMAKTGGMVEPIIFVAVMGAVMGLVLALFSIVGLGAGQMAAAGFASIFIMPIGAVIGSLVGAAILFVVWKLMGSDTTYETAYRCLAYATVIYPVTAILSVIPYVSGIVAVIWGSYLLIEASVAVHGRTRQAAQLVFGILGVLLLISNVSSEYAARNMASKLEGLGSALENYQNLPPEQAGEALGEFLKGMEKGMGKPIDK